MRSGSQHLISEALFKFEQEEQQLILQEQYYDWNTWQIIKKSAYYAIRNDNFKFQAKKHTSKSKLTRLLTSFTYLVNILKIAVTKRKAIFLFTNTNYKLEKTPDGKFVDIFIDYFLNDIYNGTYIYNEDIKGGVKAPALVQNDLIEEGKLIFTNLIYFFLNKGRNQAASHLFAEKLNVFFKDNSYPFQINAGAISLILKKFHTELVLFSGLWKLIHPKAIFFVDGIPAGAMAAANRQDIPVYDFQHGFVIKDKPDYIVAEYLKPFRQQMALPDYILLFGDFFKDVIAKCNFWSPESLLVIGNYRVSNLRKEVASKQRENNDKITKILLASQNTTFAHTKIFLPQLLPMLPDQVMITVKCHVRESKENNDFYKQLAADYPTKIVYREPDVSLVDLMANHDMVASYHSTAIFDALALGLPVITIGTEEFPLGTNSLVDIPITDVLKSAPSVKDFAQLLEDFQQNEKFKSAWLQACQARAGYFYAFDYDTNLIQLKHKLNV